MATYTIKTGCYTSATAYANSRKIVRTSEGNLHCVYYRKVVTYYNIYYSKSTDNGQTWIETQLTDENYSQQWPSIAADSNDCLHVVWRGAHAGSPVNTLQIRYIKYDGSWGSIINLTNEEAARHQDYPSMAIDGNDCLHIVWQGPSITTTVQIRYIKYDGSWSTIIDLTNDVSYHQRTPCVIVDGNGYIHVVFRGRQSGSIEQIRHIKYTDSWQSVENLTNENYNQYHPCIIVDNIDSLHVVWQGTHSGSTTYYQIRYIKYNGSSWETIVNLTNENYDQEYPSILADYNNNLHIVWDGRYGSFTQTQVRHISYTGAWGEVENLTGDSNEHRYINLLYSLYPVVGGFRINRPKTGYVFVWMVGAAIVTYYASSDLTFEGKKKRQRGRYQGVSLNTSRRNR